MTQKTYDILTLVEREERANDQGYQWYTIDPDVVYPATVVRMRAAIDGGEIAPAELVDPRTPPEIDPRGVARRYMAEAKGLPEDAWGVVLMTREQAFEHLDGERRKLRVKALDLARRWITQALHVAAGVSIGIHVLKDERYRVADG